MLHWLSCRRSVGLTTSTFLHGNSVFVWKALAVAAPWFPTGTAKIERRLRGAFSKRLRSEGWMTTTTRFSSFKTYLLGSAGTRRRPQKRRTWRSSSSLPTSKAGAQCQCWCTVASSRPNRANQPRRSVFCSRTRVIAEVVVVVLLTTSALASVFGSNQFPKEIQVFFIKHSTQHSLHHGHGKFCL